MAADKHQNSTRKLKGKVDRDGKYRENGYSYVKSSRPVGTVYGDIPSIGAALIGLKINPRGGKLECGSAAHATRYTFPYNRNFAIGRSPYGNEAHHLLPCEAFGSHLDDNHRRLLKMSDYDVNHGSNIIFLPTTVRSSRIHQLPYHRGSHPDYTAKVVVDMRKLKERMDAIIDADKDHKNWDPGDIAATVRALQDKYWEYLTNKKNASKAINLFQKSEPKAKSNRL